MPLMQVNNKRYFPLSSEHNLQASKKGEGWGVEGFLDVASKLSCSFHGSELRARVCGWASSPTLHTPSPQVLLASRFSENHD
ncbi:hypothetical protein GOP47_0010134 [Adiantum capillus-veneris]|uniref:Uncharacterized protein n=1 Tax=Adiantum capillus-veneris TaxID=13818 RepID=A0A9D4UU70_ADICA|nr:hypothetical protein GOP47_0010134 [Adiantum capillus-veneris]